MAITNGYATLAEYKAYIATRGLAGAVGTDASDDAVIEDLIEAASRQADTLSGRRFYADSSDTAYNYTGSYTALTASDLEALPDNYTAEGKPIRGLAILPTSSAWFPTYRRGVKITGKRGFPAVPDDIKEAVLETVVNVYSARSGNTSAGRMTVTAAGVVIRPDDIPEFAMTIFKSYRILT